MQVYPYDIHNNCVFGELGIKLRYNRNQRFGGLEKGLFLGCTERVDSLSFGRLFRLLGEKDGLDVRQHTTLSNGDS